MNMGTQLMRSATWFANRTAIAHERTRLTYRKLNERVNRLANGLLSLGLVKGDRVAFLSPNRHQIIEIYYACFKAGLAAVPLNARLSIHEAIRMLNHSQSSVLILGQELVDQINVARSEIETVRHYIATSSPSASMIDYETLLLAGSCGEPSVEVNLGDLASVEYTSGTTGGLKAVMSSHRNWISMARKQLLIPGIDLELNSITCHVAPLTHGTVTLVLPTFARGGCNLILRGFDVSLLLETIQNERVTHLMLVPTMINFLLVHPDVRKYDLSSIRTIIYAASPMAPDRVRQALELFGPVLIQNYGLHETTGTVTYLSKEDHIHADDPKKLKRLTSAGVPTIESDVRVINEKGEDVQPGEVGEIVERGDDTMLGYWKESDLTTKTIVDGWLHTSDLATVDEEGYIYIVDRKSDMIISGGFNIYPSEVEEVLCRHPAVFEAAVISVPNDPWGESVKAVVVLKAEAHVSEEELVDHCRKHLAAYKKPKSVDFMPELPKDSHGKVLRRILKEKYWAGQKRMVH